MAGRDIILAHFTKQIEFLKVASINDILREMDSYKKYLCLQGPYIECILQNLGGMDSRSLAILTDGLNSHVPVLSRNIVLNFSSEDILNIILNVSAKLERDENYNQVTINILQIITSDHEYYLSNADIKVYLTSTWFYFANDTVEFVNCLDEVIANFLCLFQLDTGDLFNIYLQYLKAEQNELHNHSQNVHLILDENKMSPRLKREIESSTCDMTKILNSFPENVRITIMKMPSYRPAPTYPHLIDLANYIIETSRLVEFSKWLKSESYDITACVALLYLIMIYTIHDAFQS